MALWNQVPSDVQRGFWVALAMGGSIAAAVG
jgi:hypothetical protein